MNKNWLLCVLAAVPLLGHAQGPRLLVPNAMPGLTYPAAALAAGESGSVLAQLKLSEFGEVVKVVDVQAVKGSAEFEKAVRANLERWTFRREVKGKCESVEVEGVAQIDFAVREGKPVISALGRPDVAARIAEFQPRPRDMSFQAMVASTYPPRARKEGLPAAVAVAIDYEVSSGTPVAARAVQVSFPAAPGYASAAKEFSEAATRAMMRARFQVEAGSQGDLTQACVVLQYVPKAADQ